ncbi:efflux transporter outer membrane subunit [Pseudorhodoferax sp. Leaf267]|uniref:efflux transporter outer membrane subunit n=1 Tax=Pseudorhodoferax sp. Leaf267 TaxID=1736316 RepID=UPI0006F4B936|nr:efflux transporter outer membrane subunit [Pseudorhodoferax sp. Leaf267]KQP12737.1 RND transporter [Pseudorhodoferax sp. Leaf267]
MTASSLVRRLGLAALPLVLAACGITRPPAVVDAPVPAQWQTPLAAARPHAGALPVLADWWRQAGDPVLDALIEAAQTASPTVASAAARIVEARAARVQAGAAMAPTLDGTLALSRGNTLSGGVSGGSGSASLPAFTNAQAGLQAGWEIDLFGGLAASRDAASARLDASQAQWHDARVSVAAETANTYFSERACARQLEVAGADARSRRESARLTDLSAKAGFTAPADAALARASAADASARLTQQRTQCALQRQALVALTGWDAPALAHQLDTRPTDLALPALQAVDSVPARALAQRPDVYAAELAVAAASADTGAAQAQRYPRLSLSGNIAVLNVRGGGANETLKSWSIGPLQLTLPIFDGGTRAANAEAAQARYDEAVALYRAKVRAGVREVEEALLRLQDSDLRAGDADSAVRDYQASFDATQSRYDGGLASLFDLEDARRTLFAAQTARVALQRERAEAWVALYRALGGGWTRPQDPAVAARPTPSTPRP